jgi:transposase, IS30 family
MKTRMTRCGSAFPKGTDLIVNSKEDLDLVAQENDRPRKRLTFKKPIELIGDPLLR